MDLTIQERILKTLNDSGRLSTSRIAGILGIDYNYCSKILEELLGENKIQKEDETNATYWKLKYGKV